MTTVLEHPAAPQAPRPGAGSERRPPVTRLLVVANETVAEAAVRDAVAALATVPGTRVRVVCPVPVTRLQLWTSDLSAGIAAAEARLDEALRALHALGLDADGAIGDPDPLLAIEDALAEFAADHLLVATHPEERSSWLARGLVPRARRRFGLPLTHVVVDGAGADGRPRVRAAAQAAR